MMKRIARPAAGHVQKQQHVLQHVAPFRAGDSTDGSKKPWKQITAINNHNYFTSSDPHHDMLGGGCQVRVVI